MVNDEVHFLIKCEISYLQILMHVYFNNSISITLYVLDSEIFCSQNANRGYRIQTYPHEVNYYYIYTEMNMMLKMQAILFAHIADLLNLQVQPSWNMFTISNPDKYYNCFKDCSTCSLLLYNCQCTDRSCGLIYDIYINQQVKQIILYLVTMILKTNFLVVYYRQDSDTLAQNISEITHWCLLCRIIIYTWTNRYKTLYLKMIILTIQFPVSGNLSHLPTFRYLILKA